MYLSINQFYIADQSWIADILRTLNGQLNFIIYISRGRSRRYIGSFFIWPLISPPNERICLQGSFDFGCIERPGNWKDGRVGHSNLNFTVARFPQFFSFVPCMYLSIKQSLLYHWLVWNSGYSSPSKRTGSFNYLDIKRTPTSLYRLVLYLTPCFAAEWTYIFARFLWFWLHWKARSLKGWTSELFLNFTFAI